MQKLLDETIRRAKSRSGASMTGYAIIVGLVAVASIGAVSATGTRVSDLFGGIESEVGASFESGTPSQPDPDATPGEETPPEQAPVVTLSVSGGPVASGGTATFTWDVENAGSISASYALSGNCGRSVDLGSGPHPLDWSGAKGGAGVDWSAELAGCGLTVTVAATNSGGSDSAQVSASFEALDTTPENLSFQAVVNAEPGTFVPSESAVVDGINHDVTIASTDADFRVSLAPDGTPMPALTVAPGASVRIHAQAPEDFGATRYVPFSAGGMSGTWTVRTRDAAVGADSFDLGIGATGLALDQTTVSNLVTFSGFELPLDLTIDPNIATNAGQLTYRLNTGPWTPFIAGPTIVPDVAPGTEFQLQFTATGTYETTSRAASATVSIGGASDNWSSSKRAGIATVAAFSFGPNDLGANTSTLVTSDEVYFSGSEVPLALTLRPTALNANAGTLRYRLFNGSSWSAWTDLTQETIVNGIDAGEGVQLGLMTAGSYQIAAQTASAEASIGGKAASWTGGLRAQDRSIAISTLGANSLNNNAGAVVYSSISNLTSFDGPLALTIKRSTTATTAGTLKYSLNGGAYTALTAASIQAQVQPGNTIRFQYTAASPLPASASEITVTVEAGSPLVSQSWTVGVKAAPDLTPDPFSFTDRTVIAGSGLISSETVNLTGFNGTLTLTLTPDAVRPAGQYTYSLNGGEFVIFTTQTTVSIPHTTTSQITTLQLRMQSAGVAGNLRTTSYSLGPVSGTWKVTSTSDGGGTGGGGDNRK